MYFASDYEFAAAGPPLADSPPAVPPPASDLVARGLEVADMSGCMGCHSIDGSIIVGPTWLGLAGSVRNFADGSTTVADPSYIERSIRDPGAQVVDGFPDGVMPTDFAERLSDADIAAVVAFIQSLR